jgi:hypothetical protein
MYRSLTRERVSSHMAACAAAIMQTRLMQQRLYTLVPSPHPGVAFAIDAVSEDESLQLLRDIDARLSRKRYQRSHYDSVIHDYKETEMAEQAWSAESRVIIDRLFQVGYTLGGVDALAPRLPPHVIDLKASTGEIFPHVDSLKHGGKIVAALSLLSERTMRLTMPPKDFIVGAKLDLADRPREAQLRLPPRSLYVLYGPARYDLAHDISSGPERRVSIVFRDQPPDYLPEWAKEHSMVQGQSK